MGYRAYEQADRLMVRDYCRPWTPATPEETQVRCRPSKKEYALFLKVVLEGVKVVNIRILKESNILLFWCAIV